MLVECTYLGKDECRYDDNGSYKDYIWRVGDLCTHAVPHNLDDTCRDIGNCRCRHTFKCQMLEAIDNERKDNKITKTT